VVLFLTRLEREAKIRTQAGTDCTVITVCNYSAMQDIKTYIRTASGTGLGQVSSPIQPMLVAAHIHRMSVIKTFGTSKPAS